MEDAEILLERHKQRIIVLERELSEMREVQAEIRSMHDTLVMLTTEMKHTNEHLARREPKIEEINSIHKIRIQQIITAILSVLAVRLISLIVG